MVSFDFVTQSDQSFSIEGLDIDLSSEFDYNDSDDLLPTLSCSSVSGIGDNETEPTTPELDPSERGGESDNDNGEEVEAGRDSQTREIDTYDSTPELEHASAPLDDIDLDHVSIRRYPVQPYPEEETDSDDDDSSRVSSYAPPSPSPKARRGTKTVSPRSRTTPPKSRKRSSPARRGEPRRQQNIVAQKKYRDKKVQGRLLMSDCLLELFSSRNVTGPTKGFCSRFDVSARKFLGVLKSVDNNMWSKLHQALHGAVGVEEE